VSSPRRVCLATTFYPPHNFGGDGIFVARLAGALVRRGIEVHVVHDPAAYRLLAGGEPPDAPREGRSDIVEHPLPPPRRPGLALLAAHQRGSSSRVRTHLERVLAEVKPDLLHFHNVSLLGDPGILAIDAPVKLVSLHDYWFVCPTHVLWRFEREACERPTCLACTLAAHRPPQLWRISGAIARAARAVDAFLAPSEFSRRRHAALGALARIELMPLFAPDPAESREAPPSAPYFLFAGRLEPLKGIEDLLDVFRGFRDAELHVAGAGSLEPALRRAAADLPHVRILGALPASAVAAKLRNAVAAVLPSRCFETFGLVGAEAFAVGTPAIVRRIGALTELVEPDGGGIAYSTPGELRAALERMLNPAERARFAARASRSFVERFSEARHVDRYLELADRAARRRDG
jgi:glycosyltransferase involved in cell wall biosynthesis